MKQNVNARPTKMENRRHNRAEGRAVTIVLLFHLKVCIGQTGARWFVAKERLLREATPPVQAKKCHF